MTRFSHLSYEWFIGLRYLYADRRDRFVSFISLVSVAGISLGVAALITVMSVMNGFQKEVRDRMLSVLSHVEISAVSNALYDWVPIWGKVQGHPQILTGAPYVSGQAMLNFEGSVRGVLVRGIDPAREPEVSDFVQGVMPAGNLSDLSEGSFRVAIGQEMANRFLLGVGSVFTLIAPDGSSTPAGLIPRIRQVKVAAVFNSGHYEYDSSLILMNLSDASRFFRIKGVSGLRIKLLDMLQAPAVSSQLSTLLGDDLWIHNWTEENSNWFAAVQLEKRMMFIILMLIVAVAAFNLVSMLVMLVNEKSADIAILRTLGATPSGIMRIFVIQGATLGVLGTCVGALIGIFLSNYIGLLMTYLESWFGFELLPKGIYFINHLPSQLNYTDVTLVTLVACFLSFLATIYPSWRASKVCPAQALRYE